MMTLAREQRKKTALKFHRFSSTFSYVDSREKQRFCAHLENEPDQCEGAEEGINWISLNAVNYAELSYPIKDYSRYSNYCPQNTTSKIENTMNFLSTTFLIPCLLPLLL